MASNDDACGAIMRAPSRDIRLPSLHSPAYPTEGFIIVYFPFFHIAVSIISPN